MTGKSPGDNSKLCRPKDWRTHQGGNHQRGWQRWERARRQGKRGECGAARSHQRPVSHLPGADHGNLPANRAPVSSPGRVHKDAGADDIAVPVGAVPDDAGGAGLGFEDSNQPPLQREQVHGGVKRQAHDPQSCLYLAVLSPPHHERVGVGCDAGGFVGCIETQAYLEPAKSAEGADPERAG